MQLAMIGLGRMGMNMARRLIRGGHDVVAGPGDDLAARRNKQEILGVPVAGKEAAEQGEVAGNLIKFPALFVRLILCDLFEAVIRLDTHFNEGDLHIVFLGVAEFLPQKFGVVFAILLDQLLVSLVHTHLVGNTERLQLVRHFIALNPACGFEKGSRIGVEIFTIPFAASQEQRDAVVGTGQYEPGFPRFQAVEPVVAKSVAEQDRVKTLFRSGVDLCLEPPGHFIGGNIVKTFLQKLHINFVGHLF